MKHVFISFWTGSSQRCGLISLFCVVSSWLQSWLALLTTMFHFVARLSPLRGACLPALCQARSWHTHTHTIPLSVSNVQEENSSPALVHQCHLAADPFLQADLKHVVARDLDTNVSPINICSPGLFCSLQKAIAHTPTHTYIYKHAHI